METEVSAKVTSSIFALKNADPLEWRDRRETNITATVTLSGMLAAVVDDDDEPEMIDVTPDAPAIEDGGPGSASAPE